MSLEDMIKHYFYINGYTDENIKELLKIVSKIFNEYTIKKEKDEHDKVFTLDETKEILEKNEIEFKQLLRVKTEDVILQISVNEFRKYTILIGN